MDQMANWVRFADTKATILTAGFGVVLMMLMSNGTTILTVISNGGSGGYVVGTLSVLAVAAVCYTLFWLVRALGPQGAVTYRALNRFAWPALVGTTTEQLVAHTVANNLRDEAWRQVLDLSALAQRKFHACGRAVWGFAALVILGVACVATAVSYTV